MFDAHSFPPYSRIVWVSDSKISAKCCQSGYRFDKNERFAFWLRFVSIVNSNMPLDAHTPYTKCGYRCRAQTAKVPPYPDPESMTREFEELYDSLTAVISVEISAKLCSTVRY